MNSLALWAFICAVIALVLIVLHLFLGIGGVG